MQSGAKLCSQSMTRRARRFIIIARLSPRTLTILIIALSSAACRATYPDAPSTSPTLAALQIHYGFPMTSVRPGSVVSLSAYTVDTEGVYENVSAAATWLSSDPTVVQAGVPFIRAVQPGVADLVVSYRGFSTATPVIVRTSPPPFPYLDIVPPAMHRIGVEAQAVATFNEAAGNSRNVTDTATWASSDPRVVTVTRGRVTAVGPGTAAITAAFNGVPSVYYVSIPPLRFLP